MKSYHFRLEKVLDYRRGLEREAQQELAENERMLTREKQRLGMLHKKQIETQEALKNSGEEVLDLEGLRVLSSYLHYLEHRIGEQEEVITSCEVQVVECQDKVKGAMQQRKTLERLKEKDYRIFQGEVNAEEGKVIDEMGIRMYYQSSTGSNL